MTKETLKIRDGYPLFGRDQNGWHLLKHPNDEYPRLWWWECRSETWLIDTYFIEGYSATQMADKGHTYLAAIAKKPDFDELMEKAKSPALAELAIYKEHYEAEHDMYRAPKIVLSHAIKRWEKAEKALLKLRGEK